MATTTFTDGVTPIVSAWLNDINTGVYTFNYNNILTGWGNNAFTPVRYGGTGYGGATPYVSGQLLIGNSSGALTAALLTAGVGITITNSSGGITISSSGGSGETIVSKSTSYNANVGDYVYMDTSGGALTLTLPASPAIGSRVSVADLTSSFSKNTLTIGRNGSPIMGIAADMTVKVANAAFNLRYIDGTNGWRIS